MRFLVHKKEGVYRVKRYWKQIATKTLRLVTSGESYVSALTTAGSTFVSPFRLRSVVTG
jgi:hypothetical protein